MTARSFRELLNERPFKPFRVVMAGGHAYEVHHPEAAFITKSDFVVGTDIQVDGVPAGFKICPLLHVTAVEPIAGAN